MKELGMSLGVMFLGSLFPIWLKAVMAARRAEVQFEWRIFFGENIARFVLSLVGVLIVGLLQYFDAGSIASLLSQYGISIQVGASAVTGAAIASFVMGAVPPSTSSNT